MAKETLFEHAGGLAGLHRLEDHFYASVLADPLLRPLFGEGKPDHGVAMQNSHAGTEDELHPLREVPIWTWDADD